MSYALGKMYHRRNGGLEEMASMFANPSNALFVNVKVDARRVQSRTVHMSEEQRREYEVRLGTSIQLKKVKIMADMTSKGKSESKYVNVLMFKQLALSRYELIHAENLWSRNNFSKDFVRACDELPEIFDEKTQEHFFNFFRRFGTSYVAGVSVGAMCMFQSSMVSEMSENEAFTALEAELDTAVVKAKISVGATYRSQDSLKQISIEYSVKGGHVLLDTWTEADANVWFGNYENILANPAIIDRDLRDVTFIVPAKKQVAVGAALRSYYRSPGFALDLAPRFSNQ